MKDKQLQEKEILVSILCITYNHEQYIKDAIEGFLRQKTEYAYEIIIHDDASTDCTADIIKEYEQRYPDKIKGVYQLENQYSKGGSIFNILMPMAQGKYVAFCEGDDYWIDENKLQMQVSYLEKHVACTYCFHNAIEKNLLLNNKEKEYTWNQVWKGEGCYTTEEMIAMTTPPTASVVLRKEKFPPIDRLMSKKIRMGDKIIAVAVAAEGYAYCIDKKMSVYRKNVSNSVTSNWKLSGETKRRSAEGMAEVMNNLNEYTGFRYSESFRKAIETYQRIYLVNETGIKKMCETHRSVYIYGAGECAELCAEFMCKNHLEFSGFVVTDGQSVNNSKGSEPILYWSEICGKDDCGIIVGLKYSNLQQIIEKLQGMDWCVGCYLDCNEEEYKKLRYIE